MAGSVSFALFQERHAARGAIAGFLEVEVVAVAGTGVAKILGRKGNAEGGKTQKEDDRFHK